ncbi:MAG: hypothetical protein ACFFDV_08365 [Candidatus Thorarchaeota archaeon]
MSVTARNISGYRRHQRIAITILCLTLTTAFVTSISIYVDSASVEEWSKQLEIGPVSLMVAGEGIQEDLDSIGAIPGVMNVSSLDSAHGLVSRTNIIFAFEASGTIYALNDDYLDKFPTTFSLIEGRWPENETEIAIPASLAEQVFIGVGWDVDYSFEINKPTTSLRIVGTYEQAAGDLFSYYYYSSVGVVVPSLLNENTTATRVYIYIDPVPITPFDAEGSLAYLTSIEEEIRRLYPGYPEELEYSGYAVTNYLAKGIESYLDWRNSARISQIYRASGVVLIVVLMDILVVQYIIRSKKEETSFLKARGASEFRLELAIVKEIVIMAGLSGIIGLLVGILASRIAIASTAYLQFDQLSFFTSPLILTRDTLIFVLIASFVLPVLTFLGIKAGTSGRQIVVTNPGRLGKLSRGIELIRWDIGVIIISILLMFAFYTSGPAIQRNPIFSNVMPYVPVPIFLAVGSLVVKGLERICETFSRLAKKPFGKIPASLGVRSIGKSAKTAGPIIMLLILSVTLSWNNAITDASLPETRLNHAKFTLSSDIIFHLNKDRVSRWGEFMENITDNEKILDATMISLRKMFLSTGYSGGVDFVIIDPSEFRSIGYDYFGKRLNESALDTYLLEMAENPNAAILTRDVAAAYQLAIGDTFHSFETTTDVDFYTFTVIAIVDALSQPTIPQSTYIPRGEGYSIGSRKIWVNRAYIAEKMNLARDTYSYISAATSENDNSTQIATALLEGGGKDVIYTGEWSTVDRELDTYLFTNLYKMDRAVDSMISIVSIFIMLGVMANYAIESLRAKKRDVGLMRILGAKRGLIMRVQMTELFFLLVISLLLLSLYAPLFVANSLIASLSAYSSWSFQFPISVFPVIPWITLLEVLSQFILTLAIFIIAIAVLSFRFDLKDIAGNNWALGCPIMESNNQ